MLHVGEAFRNYPLQGGLVPSPTGEMMESPLNNVRRVQHGDIWLHFSVWNLAPRYC